MEELNNIINNIKEKMENSIKVYLEELRSINTGRATPNIINRITVSCYNSLMPIGQIANIATPDIHTLIVQPYDKNIIKDIEKAIIEANLGFTPNNDGKIIRIPIPKLTEERRREFIKQAKKISENFKIQIRNLRRDANLEIKKYEKNKFSQDIIVDTQNNIQKITDEKIKNIENILSKKEVTIMEL